MIQPVAILSALMYASGTVSAAVYLRSEAADNRLRTVTIALGWIALVAHSVALHQDLVVAGDLRVGWGAALSMLGWTLALLVLLGLTRRPIEGVSLFAFPAAALSVLAAQWLPVLPAPGPVNDLVQLHAALSVLAYGVLMFAAIQALVTFFQEKRLHERRPGRLTRILPALQHQEALLVQLLLIGFVLLTCSLITGLLFVHDLFAQHLAHKTALTVAAWIVFGVLIAGRWRVGWRGALLARLTLIGFALLAIGYLGTKWVLEVGLGRAWSM